MKRRVITNNDDQPTLHPGTTKQQQQQRQQRRQETTRNYCIILSSCFLLSMWYGLMIWQVSHHATARDNFQQHQLIPLHQFEKTNADDERSIISNNKDDGTHEYSEKESIQDHAEGQPDSFNAITISADDNRPKSNAKIFFNVYVNPKAPVRSVNIAHEQIRQLSNSTVRHNEILYNIMGSDYPLQPPTKEEAEKGRIKGICGNGTNDGLHCTLLGYYPEGNEDITLTDLHSYCVKNPSDKVVYFHNKGSFRKERGNVKLRRICTTAATSPACMEMPLSSDYPCNVCGVTFQVQPYFHMTANMWVAQCSYIRTLLPPKEYQEYRTSLIKSLWEQHSCLATQFTRLSNLTVMANTGMDTTTRTAFTLPWNLTNTTFLKTFGLGRYAMERWIMSNPAAMIPCDLIPYRLSRFRHGYEDWFQPELLASRHLMTDHAILPEDRRELWLLQQELKAGEDMNFAFRNYTDTVQPVPCLYKDHE